MNEKKPIDVVVAGHLCLDIIPKFGRIEAEKVSDVLVPGTLLNIHEAIISTGGAVSNTGISLSKLGFEVELAGKVGDDLFGKAIADILKNYAEPRGLSIAESKYSSYTIIIAIPGVDRMFLHHPGTNDTFGYSDIDFDKVSEAKIFHLGYPPLLKKLYTDDGAELIRIFSTVKSLGVTTSLDMALPDPDSEPGKADWDSILKKLMSQVDIFIPSIEEIMFMIDKSRYSHLKHKAKDRDIVDFFELYDLTNISDTLLGYGAKIIALKCGHRGFYLRTAEKPLMDKTGFAKPFDPFAWSNRELLVPCYSVDRILSAAGAGDSAVAGFLAGYLKGKSCEICMKCANAAGAQNVLALDTVSGIRTWDETISMVHDSARLSNPVISENGWVCDEKNRVWKGPGDRTVHR